MRGFSKSWQILLRQEKVTLVLFGTGRVVVNTLDLIGLAFIAGAISLATADQSPPVFFPVWSAFLWETPLWFLLFAAISFTAKTALAATLSSALARFLARLEVAAARRILNRYFKGGLQRMRASTPEALEFSVLRATEFAFGRILGQAVSLFSEASLAVMIFLAMLFVDWASAFGVLLYFSVILLLFQLFTQRSLERSGKDLLDAWKGTVANIRSLTQSFRELSTLGKTQHFLEKIIVERSRVARAMALDTHLQALPRLIVESGLVLGALAFAGWQLMSGGREDFVALGVILIGSLRIMSALLPLQRAFAALRIYAPQADEAQKILAEVTEKMEESQTLSGDEKRSKTLKRTYAPTSVRLDDIVFFHDSFEDSTRQGLGRPTIDRVSLEISSGSSAAIIGPSGAGKSTLIDLILGLYEPESGNIALDGLTPKEFLLRYPGSVGYVPQKPGLVPGSLLENIAIGVDESEVDLEFVFSILKKVELDEFLASLPEGLSSDVGTHADSLSGGQIQRLGLARALFTNPALLILDEATSALDAETESSITETVAKLKGSVTTLVVAHRMSTIQNVDVVHVLDGGRLIASGPLAVLRKKVPMVQEYIRLMNIDSSS
jgi:ATP-binding cassette, subfamily B, bacterial PglK